MSQYPAEGSQAPVERSESTSAQQDAPWFDTDPEELNLPTLSSRATRSGRRYIFIDQAGDRQSSNEAIRVHVMRESHRARRQLRGLRRSANDETRDQMTILQTTVAPTLQSRAPSASQGTSRDDEAENETTTADNLDTSDARSLVDLRLLAGQCKLNRRWLTYHSLTDTRYRCFVCDREDCPRTLLGQCSSVERTP